MNKVVLVGRLTRDPEVRYSQGDSATAVARYTVAVDRRFKRDGEPTADFIPCVVFGRSAEFAEKYFRQGMRISVPEESRDRKLHKQRRCESLHNRSDCRGSGICREQECGIWQQRRRLPSGRAMRFYRRLTERTESVGWRRPTPDRGCLRIAVSGTCDETEK